MVPEGGFEPPWNYPNDFESFASTIPPLGRGRNYMICVPKCKIEKAVSSNIFFLIRKIRGTFMPMEETVIQNQENTPKESVWKKIQTFLMKSTNGMALGLFGTLIIGTIIALFAKIPVPGFEHIATFANLVKGLMGAGIGLGVALSLGCQGVSVVAIMAAGAAGNLGFGFAFTDFKMETYSGDPLSCYCSAIIAYFAITLIMRKKTPVDLILIPLVGLGFALLYCFFVSYWIHQVTILLGLLIKASFDVIPFLMCIIVSVLVGMALTAPISSVAICVAIGIGNVPLAAGAALIGCCTQMVGFATQAARDNKWGSVLAIGIGTSMLEFKNIIKNPRIWLPTIIASAILGPFAYLFGFATDSVGAGMGTSGLVGLIDTFDVMALIQVSEETGVLINWVAIIEVIGICVIAPIALVFGLDLLFRKIGWIKKGDLTI